MYRKISNNQLCVRRRQRDRMVRQKAVNQSSGARAPLITRLSNLRLAARSGVADGADALELSDSIQTSSAIGTRVRFALVVLEVAFGTAETCVGPREKTNAPIS